MMTIIIIITIAKAKYNSLQTNGVIPMYVNIIAIAAKYTKLLIPTKNPLTKRLRGDAT